MTVRTVNARPVSTFVRPSTGNVAHTQQRSRQVAGVLEQLGVNMAQKRQREFGEAAEASIAAANNKARTLAADHMPKVLQELSKPESMELTAEEFKRTAVYKEGLKQIEDNFDSPEMRRDFKANFENTVLSQYSQGKAKHEYAKLETEGSQAQQAASQHEGVTGQLAAYEDSIKSGVQEDDAFTAALASGILQGPKYLTELKDSRDWTPEQELKLAQQIKSLNSSYNMEANVALKYAKKTQDRTKRLQQFAAIQAKWGEALSNDQQASLQADMQVLYEEIGVEEQAKKNFGIIDLDALAEGKGIAGDRKLSREDLSKLKDEEIRKALASGDVRRLVQLSAIPGEQSGATRDYFTQAFGSLASADPANTQMLTRAMTYANAIKDNLGWAHLQNFMSEGNFAAYVSIAGTAEFSDMETAINQQKEVAALQANGKTPPMEGFREARTSVVDSLLSNPKDRSWYNPARWFGDDSPMNRGSLESLLNPHFKQWEAEKLTEDQMSVRAQKIMSESAWGGYLNGAVLGSHIEHLTVGTNGNPYGDKTGEDLLDAYREGILEELQADNPDLTEIELIISDNPEKVFLRDKGGLTIPSSLVRVQDISAWIKGNVPTLKEEVIEDARQRKHYTHNPFRRPNG